MNQVSIDLDGDQLDSIISTELKNMLKYESNELIRTSLHNVIAYTSVPGQYEDGKYDLESIPPR